MRKIILIFLMLSLLLSICSCNIKHFSVEESKTNYLFYQKKIEQIVYSYDLEIIETIDFNIENQDLYKDLSIFDEDENIQIRMINSAYNSNVGVESFSIDYSLNNISSRETFNVKLFVDLVNCISGKKIAIDICDEFLNAPESKYAAEKDGYEKKNNEIIVKKYSMNFFEDWTMYHIVYPNEEVLSFGGLTAS